MDEVAERFLYLVRDNPSLLPTAPDPCSVAQMDHRRYDEVHDCSRCGQRARWVYVTQSSAGSHWLDLCDDCSAAIRIADRP